jgi:hypothetical protein
MKDSLLIVPFHLAELRPIAGALLTDLQALGDKPLTRPLRKRLIEFRAALFQLGMFDPVLARLDSATVPQVTVNDVTDELALIAGTL